MIEEFIKQFKGTKEQKAQIKSLILEFLKFSKNTFNKEKVENLLSEKLKDSHILKNEGGYKLVEGYVMLRVSSELKDNPIKMIPTVAIIGNKTGCVYQIVV